MKQTIDDSKPKLLENGQWHMPYVSYTEDLPLEDLIHCSVARCARTSYSNHDGTNPNPSKDMALYYSLLKMQHFSCFEHCATPMLTSEINIEGTVFDELSKLDKGTTHIDMSGQAWSANFKSWIQFRKLLE